MDIDEFTHAVGVIFCRPPLGDLDLAPGPMDVDADEEIDGAVAAVLVIVTVELAPLRRGRPADPPPELDPNRPPAPPGPAGPRSSRGQPPILGPHRPSTLVVYAT